MRRVRTWVGGVLLCAALVGACTPPPEEQLPDPTTSSTTSSTSTSTSTTSTTTTTTTTVPAAPTSITVVGDFGYDHPYIQELGSMVRGWKPDYVITTGDNLQTVSLPVTGTDRYDRLVGRHFCTFMAGVAPGPFCPSGGQSAGKNRFFPAAGNHDHVDGPLSNYLSYFTLPGPGTTSTSPTGSELYYDVVLGPVHLFVIDSETIWNERNLPPAQRTMTNLQRNWLQQAATASNAPWKIVTLHDPPFSSGSTYGSAPYVQFPFASWGIDVVFAGHEALYERLRRDGVSYIVNGLGGGHPAPFGTPIAGSQVRFNEDVATAVRLHATSTSLAMQMITVEGVVVDSYQFPA